MIRVRAKRLVSLTRLIAARADLRGPSAYALAPHELGDRFLCVGAAARQRHLGVLSWLRSGSIRLSALLGAEAQRRSEVRLLGAEQPPPGHRDGRSREAHGVLQRPLSRNLSPDAPEIRIAHDRAEVLELRRKARTAQSIPTSPVAQACPRPRSRYRATAGRSGFAAMDAQWRDDRYARGLHGAAPAVAQAGITTRASWNR